MPKTTEREIFGFQVQVYDKLFKKEKTVIRCHHPTKRAFLKAIKALDLFPIGDVETLYVDQL